ncbi:hypothetical protein [Pseudooceanicola algae]|uniref:Uncharacterized protein n=1 Tax=Pseudooceanicola algae TaxID=1537215 RepID=A0A418SCU6_9RHOB|nr:hypothetical protein [Pseudooceanicola algae]QPM92389.1 hypothetical protein PSAL_036530 [Pseudooceanicola algae]
MADDPKTIIPTEVQRHEGRTINQTARQIDPASRHRVDVNANAQGSMKQPGDPLDLTNADQAHGADEPGQEASVKQQPEALEESEPRDDKKSDYIRPAGPKEMENPPKRWTETDEEVDQSFPASDPPANY